MVLRNMVRRSAACVSLAVAQALHTRCDRGVRFGVVADVQYCDIDDARNFAGTEVRFYRGSLDGARRAAQGFEEARLGRGLDFVAQLGDLIDGQNAGGYGALKGEKPRSKKALDEVLEALGACPVPHYHCVGNHELYNFEPDELTKGPLNAKNHVIASGKLYHAFVHDGWTFVVLNPYEASSSLPKHTHGYKEAAKVLTEKNPNPVLSDEPCNFFEGLEGEGMRFVPFNGAVGETQRKWLAEVLSKAPGPCIVFSHLPLFHESCSWRNVAWDSPEVLEVLREAGNVVAVVAGHSHSGGYALDDHGIHHVVVEATLTHETAYGVCECLGDGSITIAGEGSVPSRVLAPPPSLARRLA